MNDPKLAAVDIITALEAETMRAERAECAEAGMPASDHPVVQRAARILDAARTRSAVTAAHLAIMTALEHMTADDLRNIPAGRALLAEGWDALIESMSASGEFHDVDLRTMERLNPYLGGDPEHDDEEV